MNEMLKNVFKTMSCQGVLELQTELYEHLIFKILLMIMVPKHIL